MKTSEKKYLIYNTITSFVYQLSLLICGFIVPHLIINYYGSEVNGLVNSIKQFLQIIAFLELGVGAVVQTSLYKPLAEKNNDKISKVIASGTEYFRMIGKILLAYVIVLIVLYPLLVNSSYNKTYTILLILAMSISSFAQYYFGLIDGFLLMADQRGYVLYIAQTITLILSTILSIVIVKMHYSIQLLKLVTSLIYIIRPILIRIYINQHYHSNRHIKYQGEPIKQKWNGIAQHISAVVLDSTDIVVLSTFSNLTNVSVYSVYSMVVSGIRALITALTSGAQSLMGNYWAREEYSQLNLFFSNYEWSLNTVSTYLWDCTFVLIVPFVYVYTKGISDINYIYPTFGFIITLAYYVHSLRLPYNLLILSVGHYRQTQKIFFIAALMNIIISVLAVKEWGLVGVAIGTFASMAYQMIHMSVYCHKNILYSGNREFYKQIFVDALTSVLVIFAARLYLNSVVIDNYSNWMIASITVALIAALIVLSVNEIFYRVKTNIALKKIFEVINKNIIVLNKKHNVNVGRKS